MVAVTKVPVNKKGIILNTFPYKIPRRLYYLSLPRRYIYYTDEDLPRFTNRGIRQSALTGRHSDKNVDMAWPSLRRLFILKRMYKDKFSQERIERIDRMIEASNATVYSKMANLSVNLKKHDIRDIKRKKGWTESDWKKHMDYISQIAAPKKEFSPAAINRGQRKPLEVLLPRIRVISDMPYFKCYKRMSQEGWYRNPEKVAPGALKYQISERIKKLAVARAIPREADEN